LKISSPETKPAHYADRSFTYTLEIWGTVVCFCIATNLQSNARLVGIFLEQQKAGSSAKDMKAFGEFFPTVTFSRHETKLCVENAGMCIMAGSDKYNRYNRSKMPAEAEWRMTGVGKLRVARAFCAANRTATRTYISNFID